MSVNRLVGILLVFLVLAPFGGCRDLVPEYKLGQDFALKPGESAYISGEALTVRFKEVINDSRCPADVICIWAGQVYCLLEKDINGKSELFTLTQPGSSSSRSFQTYHRYFFEFEVLPYPQSVVVLSKSDYSLRLTITVIA